jgi:hypothetical protein
VSDKLWLTCRDPERMLRALPEPPSERKLLLVGVAACRAASDLFTDDRCRAAVEVAERFADGAASEAELADAQQQATVALTLTIGPPGSAPRPHRTRQGRNTSWAAFHLASVWRRDDRTPDNTRENVAEALAYLQNARRGRYRATRKAQVQLVRDVFGHPFRAVPFDPDWRTATARGLARAVYAERAFDRLPILADALEDAGCDSPDVLAHCRGEGPHARGCWVVDLVLGKG